MAATSTRTWVGQACPVPYCLTKTQARVMAHAYRRPPDYCICPTVGLYAAAQTAVIRSLRREGYVAGDGRPTLTENGIAVARSLVERGA
jgi:hypothetical protein